MLEIVNEAKYLLRKGKNSLGTKLADLEKADLETIVQMGAAYDVFQGVSLKDAGPAYKHARTILEFGGFTTVIAVEELSLSDLVKNNKLLHCSASLDIDWYKTPRAMEVAINPKKIAPVKSQNLSFKETVAWLKTEEERLRLTTGLGNSISLPLHIPSTLVQLEISFSKLNHEERLYENVDFYKPCYVRGDGPVEMINKIGKLAGSLVGRSSFGAELSVFGAIGNLNIAPRAAYAIVLPPRN